MGAIATMRFQRFQRQPVIILLALGQASENLPYQSAKTAIPLNW